MKINLSAPVGDLSSTKKKGNIAAEVKSIKEVFIDLGISPDLEYDDNVTLTFIQTIKDFQKLFSKTGDGRIDPGENTLSKINGLISDKSIVVNLKRQVVNAFKDKKKVYSFHCASGSNKFLSPPGYYGIYRKHRKYRSKTYDAQMDYAMFFHKGYAIHMAYAVEITSFLKWGGFDSLGSHGCIRLSETNARKLFDWAPMKTTVVVLHDK